MTEFNRTTITSRVPAYVKEEGTIVNQTTDFIVFKTKKKRSSRGLTRYIPFKRIISIRTDKNDLVTIHYVDESFPIEHRNIELDKITSSNIPGFISAKLQNGTLLLNGTFAQAHTETSSAPTKLEKSGAPKEVKKEKKKDKDKKKKA